MKDKGTELIEQESQSEGGSPFELSLAAIADTNLVAIAAQADERLAAFEKIWKGSLSRTNPQDWVNEGGKPYLQASGSQKIARWLGVSWRVNPPVEEDLGGGHYLIRYTGEFALGGAVISEVGTRSSKDPFFAKAKGVQLPASEIDKGNVMKAAYTNLLGRGISTLLGLRNLTWQDVEQYASVKQGAVASVSYAKPASGQTGSKPQTQGAAYPAQPDAPATEPQIKAIHAVLKERLGIEGEIEKHEKVAKILGLKDIPTSMGKLTKGQASKVIEALQKEAQGQAPEEGEA